VHPNNTADEMFAIYSFEYIGLQLTAKQGYCFLEHNHGCIKLIGTGYNMNKTKILF
jgi:hypothetical protein